jgi:hypothetical protein
MPQMPLQQAEVRMLDYPAIAEKDEPYRHKGEALQTVAEIEEEMRQLGVPVPAIYPLLELKGLKQDPSADSFL